jgi:hypothetical protein
VLMYGARGGCSLLQFIRVTASGTPSDSFRPIHLYAAAAAAKTGLSRP